MYNFKNSVLFKLRQEKNQSGYIRIEAKKGSNTVIMTRGAHSDFDNQIVIVSSNNKHHGLYNNIEAIRCYGSYEITSFDSIIDI